MARCLEAIWAPSTIAGVGRRSRNAGPAWSYGRVVSMLVASLAALLCVAPGAKADSPAAAPQPAAKTASSPQMYVLVDDGRVLRIDPSSRSMKLVGRLPGKPSYTLGPYVVIGTTLVNLRNGHKLRQDASRKFLKWARSIPSRAFPPLISSDGARAVFVRKTAPAPGGSVPSWRIESTEIESGSISLLAQLRGWNTITRIAPDGTWAAVASSPDGYLSTLYSVKFPGGKLERLTRSNRVIDDRHPAVAGAQRRDEAGVSGVAFDWQGDLFFQRVVHKTTFSRLDHLYYCRTASCSRRYSPKVGLYRLNRGATAASRVRLPARLAKYQYSLRSSGLPYLAMDRGFGCGYGGCKRTVRKIYDTVRHRTYARPKGDIRKLLASDNGASFALELYDHGDGHKTLLFSVEGARPRKVYVEKKPFHQFRQALVSADGKALVFTVVTPKSAKCSYGTRILLATKHGTPKPLGTLCSHYGVLIQEPTLVLPSAAPGSP